VRDDHHRLTERIERLAQRVENRMARLDVEHTGWLVGEQHSWRGHERVRNRNALLLSAGELGTRQGTTPSEVVNPLDAAWQALLVAELPRGTVTFLFTDVEGSTQLVKKLRGRYGLVLIKHQEILREAFARHGGHEIDTQGDAFFVAFEQARDAVLCAVDAQRALLSHEWPEGAKVRVRMGIHTGQAAPEDGRYTGIAVHRAARISAAGHGGQVLVSQAARELLDEEGDLLVGLQNLGVVALKDLDRPVRLYQVTGDGLPERFPPLRGTESLLVRWRVPVSLVALAVLTGAGVSAFFLFGGSSGGLTVPPNSLGIIDPAKNKVVAQVGLPKNPQAVAVGAGGVWVGNVSDKSLSHIDPTSLTLGRTIPLFDLPTGVAAGAGAVWVENGLVGVVKRIDPQLDVVLKTVQVVPRSQAGSGGAVTLGGGVVWVVFPVGSVAEMRPSTSAVAATSYAGRNPSGIAFGKGSLWVSNRQDNTVSRFDLAHFGSRLARKISAGRGPSGIAVGAGAAWVTNADDDSVSRIDPVSNSSKTIPVGKTPTGITYGNGAVWVANSGDGTVSRIDPARGKVVATIAVGNSPVGIAAGFERVWVTVQSAT
jgi:YVTN family beta-propeller protein